MEMRERKAKQQNFEAANAERRRQIVQDSVRLLKLAASLKAEVDATGKDTVSPAAMVKAAEIERLAHIVKEKMKLTVGAG
jgi:IS30 family transposase